jgi:hypothetical protein
MGFCIVATLGALVACGMGKLLVDLKNSTPRLPPRRDPWDDYSRRT